MDPMTAIKGASTGASACSHSQCLCSPPTELFLQFDADKSGTVSPYELRTALKATGKGKPGPCKPSACGVLSVAATHLSWPREGAGL